ncbi:nickel-dependent lactate racemase [Ruminococcaceae bacterium AM07-15]|nr:nickel-dependent lactate racemase [Ruminococcaceae bacterium AM07-15]
MKKTISLPYGTGEISAQVEESQLLGIVQSQLEEYEAEKSPEELLRQAMENSIGTSRLEELAKGKKKVVVLCSDHTRPVPSKLILPPMLGAIRRGNPQAEITLLIATGCHRGTTRQELVNKLGAEMAEKEHILIHDCAAEEDMVDLGVLPSGGRLRINKAAVEADLLVAEGFIEPHFFAGFSGGRKSVLPGIAARETVYANHCSQFIDDPHARAGILEGNPIHRDMVWAARKAGLAYIVNVVLGGKGQVIGAFAGDFDEAHRAGTEFLASLCQKEAPEADIVVTSNNGYPLDQNIYQAVKGMSTAEVACRKGGVIVIAARCEDGNGGEVFWRTFQEEKDPKVIMDTILATPQDKTQADQWQSQVFARVLMKCRVVLVSQAPDEMVRDLHMTPAHSLEEGLRLAQEMLGEPQAKILVVPQGISTILRPQAL